MLLAFAVLQPVPMLAHAQSEVSKASAESMMPLASVVGAGVGASVALPVALSTAGAVLVIKGVEASGTGTVYVLERVSDGARASVQVSGKVAEGVSTTVGTAVTVSAIATGLVLSVGASVIAYIPNEIGRSLMHNTKVTP